MREKLGIWNVEFGMRDHGRDSMTTNSKFQIPNSLILNCGVSDLQPAVDDPKCLAQFGFGDAERRVREERVPPQEGVEPLLAEETSERRHPVRGAVERSQGEPFRPVPH